MNWKWQLVISIGGPIFTAVLSYLAAIKKANKEIDAVKINAETEIKKIKEESDKEIKNIETEYQKQIEKMKVETEERIKIKITESELVSKNNADKVKNEAMGTFFSELLKNPKKGEEKLKALIDIKNKYDSKINK